MSGAVATRLAELERELATLGADELPRLLGELERLRAAMWARLVGLSANGQSRTGHDQSDELLGVKEAARRLGRARTTFTAPKTCPSGCASDGGCDFPPKELSATSASDKAARNYA